MTFITFPNIKYSFDMGIDNEVTRLRVCVRIIYNTGFICGSVARRYNPILYHHKITIIT